jgi:4-diphosphocytidyl-2-C-methyl-D-erythritol kinase
MIHFPPCKINLGLNVTSKRTDGYHNIETCFYPVPLTDILEIIRADTFSFNASGNSIPGRSDDNLCIRAYELLNKDFSLPPVAIHLHKVIPTGAGLGGGSSDAAYTFRLLNTVFELGLSAKQLMNYAQLVGSDCAFFIEGDAKLGSGRGEILEHIKVSIKGKFLVLLKPDVHVSTAEAYQAIVPNMPKHSVKEIVEATPLSEWKHLLKNDFEESVFKRYPIIQHYKKSLYDAGALYASMSGSGSSIFGIFNNSVNAQQLLLKDVIWSGRLTH